VIWSDEARLLRHPFVTYDELARADDERPLRTAIERALLLLFVIGAFVSITSAGRLVAFHVVTTMAFWSFLPVIQGVVFALTTRVLAPRSDLKAALALHFRGYAPWHLFLLGVAGVCIFAPDVAATLTALLRTGALPGLLVATWIGSGVLTFACFRSGIGLSRARAAAATALYYLGYVIAIVAYYLAMNEIQPQLPWAP
jgi:hypothetical protein